jgi:hypothetical protein
MRKQIIDTSHRLFHVFACPGPVVHVHPGTAISKIGRLECPTCGKPVSDITNSNLGQSYFAFARQDLGEKQ